MEALGSPFNVLVDQVAQRHQPKTVHMEVKGPATASLLALALASGAKVVPRTVVHARCSSETAKKFVSATLPFTVSGFDLVEACENCPLPYMSVVIGEEINVALQASGSPVGES